MESIISISKLNKTFKGGFQALKNINLEVKPGEIFALLGPNGAGKTTLIKSICGLTMPTEGKILVGGYDIVEDYKKARRLVGLVPQELTTDAFETVWNTVCFSRGVFGKKKDSQFIEKILKDLSLWDKKSNILRTLSGGMKRRVMIAKALSHEPKVLFLDEPTAGVDVELRKGMWDLVSELKALGVTIILTTHYIEEAELMADRIGFIKNGEIIMVEDKDKIMKKMSQKTIEVTLSDKLDNVPTELKHLDVRLFGDKMNYLYDESKMNMQSFLNVLVQKNINVQDIQTKESSLEDIFVQLVKK